MQLIAPVTDYIRASVLTTHGDLVERGAVIPERLAGGAGDLHLKAQGVGASPIYEALTLRDTGVHIGQDTRNAGGDQVITGVGFESSVIIFLARDDVGGNVNMSWGFSTSVIDIVTYLSNNGANQGLNASRSMWIDRGGGNSVSADVTVYGIDGFTLTWEGHGVCGAEFTYLCLP